MNSKYKFLISNTGLFFISTFSSKFLVFLLMPIYTKVLAPGEFNTVDLMTQTANLLIPLVSLGIPNSIIRFGLDKNYSKRGVFTVAALSYAFGFLILLAFYPVIVKITFISHYVRYLYLYLLCSCLRTLVQQFVRARMYTKLYALDGIMATVSTLVLVYVFLIKMNLGAMGYIMATIGADFISFVFLSLVSGCWKYFSFEKATPELAKEMLGYCLPLIPTGIFWWVTNVSDRYLVTAISGATIGGLYAISYKIPSIVNIFSTVFTEAWQISAVKEGQSKNPEVFFKNVFRAYQAIIFIAGSGLILICKPLIAFMVDEAYYDSWQFIPVLIMATIFSCLSGFMSSIYMVDKNGKANLYTMMTGAISNVIMNLILIPKWGAQGAAIATFVSYFIVFVLRAIGTKKIINIDISPLFMLANILLIGSLSFIMINEIKHWILFSILFVIVIVVFNSIPLVKFMLQMIEKLKKKRA